VTTADDLGLRGRQRERLRKRIHDSALELFEEKGFEGTTISEIASAAETSPRTVFRHFGSKEELIFLRSPSMLALVRDLLSDRPASEPPYQAVKAALCALAERFESERAEWMRRVRIIADSPTLSRRQAEVREAWIRGLAEGVAARQGAEGPNLECVAVVLSAFGALSAAWDFWVEAETSSLPELLDRAFLSIEREVIRP
jgi:AcrR family transcriptional regulator